MKFKFKLRKLKLPKVRLDKIAVGAVSGFAMGGPFGAGAGALAATTSGKKGGALGAAPIGLAAGGIVGAATGSGFAGKVLAPKAKNLFSSAKSLIGGGNPDSAITKASAFVGASSAVVESGGSMVDKVQSFLSGASEQPGSMAQAGILPAGMDMKKLLLYAGFIGLVGIIILKR